MCSLKPFVCLSGGRHNSLMRSEFSGRFTGRNYRTHISSITALGIMEGIYMVHKKPPMGIMLHVHSI
jgi:hypothetical protein